MALPSFILQRLGHLNDDYIRLNTHFGLIKSETQSLQSQITALTPGTVPAYYKTNVLNYGGTIYDGTTSAVAAILLALADVPNNGTLYFPNLGNGTYLIDSSINLVSLAYPDIFFEFEPGAKLKIDNGCILTFNNTGIVCQLVQCFEWVGTGTFAGTLNIYEVYTEWLGVIADGLTDDSIYFEKAILLASLSKNKKVKLLCKVYSISNVSMLDYITVEGQKNGQSIIQSRELYSAIPSPGEYDIGNYNIFKGTSLTNITLENITIKGLYDTSWGYQVIHAIGSYEAENLIFFYQCTNVELKNVKLTNTYSSYPTIAVSRDNQMETIYGQNQIKLSFCTNVTLDSCNWTDSTGEAWQIWRCENVRVSKCDFIVDYCVSMLDLTCCQYVEVHDNKFFRLSKANTGNLLNMHCAFAESFNNKFRNGEHDFGGEYLAGTTIGKTFVLESVSVHDNKMYNGSFVQSTTNGVHSSTYPMKNTKVYNNEVIIDLDTYIDYQTATSGTREFIGINLAPYQNQKDAEVYGNTIKVQGTLNSLVTNKFMLLSGRMYISGLIRDDIKFVNNTIDINFTNYNASYIDDEHGNLYFDKGTWNNLVIFGNVINSPFGSQFKNYEEINKMSIVKNIHTGGRNFFNFPFSDTSSYIDKLKVVGNEFYMLEDSYSHTSANITTNGFGLFFNLIHGRTTEITEMLLKDNIVKAAGFAFIGNIVTSTDINNDISIIDNDVTFKDIVIGTGTMHGLRLGRAYAPMVSYSKFKIKGNTFRSDTATNLMYAYAFKEMIFKDNTLIGDFDINFDTVDVSAITTSKLVWKDNEGFDSGSSSVSRTNTDTCVTKYISDNDGFLDVLSGSLSWDPSNLVDGAQEISSAVTINGVEFGDKVLVGTPYDMQGVSSKGYVSSANNVKIVLQNNTGGSIDFPVGTYTIKVIK